MARDAVRAHSPALAAKGYDHTRQRPSVGEGRRFVQSAGTTGGAELKEGGSFPHLDCVQVPDPKLGVDGTGSPRAAETECAAALSIKRCAVALERMNSLV